MSSEQRMRLTGLHHVTAIAADLDATIAFYRDVLGLPVAEDGVSDDDPGTRHVWFGTGPGLLVSFLHYPGMPAGVVGRGSTHHFAFVVESAEELAAWREYLEGRGVPSSGVFDRGAFRSLYLRDPDGHVVEIATRSAA